MQSTCTRFIWNFGKSCLNNLSFFLLRFLLIFFFVSRNYAKKYFEKAYLKLTVRGFEKFRKKVRRKKERYGARGEIKKREEEESFSYFRQKTTKERVERCKKKVWERITITKQKVVLWCRTLKKFFFFSKMNILPREDFSNIFAFPKFKRIFSAKICLFLIPGNSLFKKLNFDG